MAKIKSIIILGGGTSGLTTALIIHQQYPNIDLKVIASSNIGTVGVGEGATEHWKYFCEATNIRIEDTLVDCDATIKAGILFKNWGVPDYNHATVNSYATTAGDYLAVYAKLISEKHDPLDIIQKRTKESTVPKAWVELREPCPVNQFHFNTFKTNDFLVKICNERGIEIVDDTIDDVTFKDNGYLKSLIGTTGTYSADFFIDASGFSRLLIKKMGAKWVSYKDNMWLNSAIAFPTEDTDEYPLYTTVTGMDYGWMWQTPVRGRWGNGYVFCDKYINFDQAKSEVERLLGKKIDVAKQIKFDPGKIDRPWIKNVASVGLSSSFVEPLESSAISQGILQTFLLQNLLPAWQSTPNEIEEIYNNRVQDIWNNILDFITVHYVVPREDTPFWKDLKEKRDQWMPKSLKKNLKRWQKSMPLVLEFDQNYVLFTADNWAVTLYGLGLIDSEAIKEEYSFLPKYIRDQCDNIVNTEKDAEENLEHLPHKEGLLQFVENYKREVRQ